MVLLCRSFSGWIIGTINNDSTSDITNSGTINNCGTFNNNGTFTGNPVQNTCPPPLPSTFTVPSATGAGPVTFATPAGGFSKLVAVPQSGLSPTPPAGSYPFGFFSWSITGFAPATSVTLTITFPSPVPAGTQYLKLVGGTWVPVPIVISGNTIIITIQDNGPFDADPTVGTISDPGGLLVTTAEGTQQLINTINGMHLSSAITSNLDWKLQGVVSSLNLGQNSGAKNQLNSFINFVNTQTGKTIAQDQATTIIQGAQNIINAIQ